MRRDRLTLSTLTRALVAGSLIAAVVVPTSAADPLTAQPAARAAGDRLLEIQLESGAFPWIVGTADEFQNVQGITAQGLLAAYSVTLDSTYLDDGDGGGAVATRNWLADHIDANPTGRFSSGTMFFLGEYALLGLDPADMDLAQRAFDQTVANNPAPYAPSPAGVIERVITLRKGQGHTNLGLWDAALLIRAAQDVGRTDAADEMAATLTTQMIVDPFAPTANWYELGLAGFMFGLGEADLFGHETLIDRAHEALLATQCEDGSFAVTYGGTVYCSDVQSTAYAAIGLLAVGDHEAAATACDHIIEVQAENGGFEDGGTEYAEVDAEAAVALAGCTVPLPKGVLDYADAARGIL